jgi:hypothetical protein
LHRGATALAVASVNVELADHRLAWDFGLILLDDVAFRDGTAAVGTGGGQGCLVAFIDLVGKRGRSMAVLAVVVAGFATGCFGLLLGWTFGERRRLPFAGPLDLFERAP